MPSHAEMERKREEIIDYYLNVTSRSKLDTIKYFKTKKVRRRLVNNVIRRYEQFGNVKEKKRSRGRKLKTQTPENFRKLQELYKMDPSITVAEAAHLLGIDRSTAHRLRKKVIAGLDPTYSVESGDATGTGAISPENVNQNETNPEDHNFGDMAPSLENEDESQDLEQKPATVKPHLKSLRMKMSARHSPVKCPVETVVKKRCLICLESSLKKGTNNKVLQENVTVIFVLKTLVGLSSDDLIELMNNSKGSDPKNWTSFCDNCNDLVEKAIDIKAKIRHLEDEMTKCKQEIAQNLKKTSSVKFRRICDEEKLFLEKIVREEFRRQKRESSSVQSNPFCQGDKEAESRLQMTQINYPMFPVKEEAMEPEMEMSEGDMHHDQDFVFDCEEIIQPEVPPSLIPSMPLQLQSTETPVTNNNGNTDSIEVTPTPTLGVCDLCGAQIRPLAIPSHKLKEHGVVMEGYILKRCSFQGCKYETLYDDHLAYHLSRHNPSKNGKTYACQFCGKVLKDGKGLKRHEEIHKNAETRPYQCEICGASFAVQTYLYLHSRLSHEGRYFPSTKRKRPKN